MQLQAVFFDFDGIVVDSEPLHHKAFSLVFEPMDLPLTWETYYADYLGFDDRDVVRERFRRAGRELDDATMSELIAKKAQVFLELIESNGVTPFPGAVDLIRAVNKAVPSAIVSGALQGDIEPILRTLGLENVFPVMITADQVEVSKPDPESYRVAFQQLKIRYPDRVEDPGLCVAIEDTAAGITAAQGAALRTLAVTNTYKRDELASADRVVESLESVTLDVLDTVVADLL